MVSNSDLDGAVARLLQAENRATRVRRAPKAKRKEIKRQQARSRMSVDLDPRIMRLIDQIAEREQVSKSGVVNLFLAIALVDHATKPDEAFSGDRIQVSESPKWEYTVSLGNLDKLLDDLILIGFHQ